VIQWSNSKTNFHGPNPEMKSSKAAPGNIGLPIIVTGMAGLKMLQKEPAVEGVIQDFDRPVLSLNA
jgi:hypothetical protein